MVKIFAKYNSNEKIVMPVPREAVGAVIKLLNEKLGGSWLWVDKIEPGEGIRFSDDTIYKGFSPSIDRYTDAIIKI